MNLHEDGVDPGSRWGRVRLSGPKWVMESRWAELPAEVLQTVVTFLPLASLVRFKAVSREWNRLISNREFVSRHAQAAAPEEYVLVVVQIECKQGHWWEVLDVANRRFFTLSSDFLTEYLKREGIAPPSRDKYRTMAADGGLVFVSYSFDEWSSVVLVCNPILKTVKHLPELIGCVKFEDQVVMRTDRVSMEYEVYVVNDNVRIFIYESKVPPARIELGHLRPSKFLKNEFYEPFTAGFTDDRQEPSCAGIVSYNRTTGVLSDLGVAFPTYLDKARNLQLVVSNARLFCVARSYPESSGEEILEIFEIVMERKGQKGRKSVRLATMPSDLLSLVLGEEYFHDDPFVAVGCANSILICSASGWSVAFDLSKKMWDEYPRNKLWIAVKHLDDGVGWAVCGSNYCLSLCAP